jgi:hypothetical protein
MALRVNDGSLTKRGTRSPLFPLHYVKVAYALRKVAELSNCSWQVRMSSSMHEAEAWCEAVSDVSVSHG